MSNNVAKRLTLAIAILNGLIFVAHLVAMSQSPSDGTQFSLSGDASTWQSDGVLISVIDSNRNDLRDGDRLLKVDGQPVAALLDRVLCFSRSCAVSSPIMIEAGATADYTIQRDGEIHVVKVSYSPFSVWRALSRKPGGVIYALITYVMFLVLLLRKPDEPAIRAIALTASGFVGSLGWAYGLSVIALVNRQIFWLYQFATNICYLIGVAGLIHFVLVFPRPLPIINRRRWLVSIPYAALYLLWGGLVIGYTVTVPDKLLWMGWASKASTFVDNTSSALVLIGIVFNYRSLKHRSERQQVHLVVLSVILVVALGLVLRGLPLLLLGRSLLSNDAISVIALIIPATIAISIQRLRLWALEPIINRTFVYLSLSSIIIGLYMVIVAAVGGLLQARSAPFSGLVATGIVAVIFEPLRNRLQRTVNRIMYGERDDPAAVLSQLAHHLETGDTPAAILPNLVQTIARALKIPHAAIWLPVGTARTEPVASWGTPAEQVQTISLTYQNEAIGHLVVAPRGPREQFTRPEQDLLATIAALTATTARAVQLSDELRRSRQRIVSAREEERRRLRRDLHDGLGPQLASQALGMEAVSQLIPTQPEKAQALLGSLKAQAQEAILDVRRLVYDLRPPALDDLGLISALRQSASRYETGTLRFSFDVPEELPELPAAVETAVYRIAQEAMTNVVRHAMATRCNVRLFCQDAQIVVEVCDNGHGLPPEHRSGVGLQAMRERTTELNGQYTIVSQPEGGTRVQARLPLEVDGE